MENFILIKGAWVARISAKISVYKKILTKNILGDEEAMTYDTRKKFFNY